MKKLELHWQIMIGMVLGLVFGFGMTYLDWGKEFVINWIAPLGTIFIKLLKLIAVPLILASLIKGISDLKDISKFRNIGLRTIGIYIGTTTVAIILGLVLVNVIAPGNGISEETIEKLTSTYASDEGVTAKLEEASRQKESGPLKFLEDMVPDNAVAALGNNQLMLQVIFFTIFIGISMLLIGEKSAKTPKRLL